ncbi:MAG: Chemotaxis protein cheW [Candidatus Magnetoglobus multicellularis str. Araruama]|uniref:Chemotaxis protein cheW n=1 Tax=Candidatus Magnetoglobus multicellularis str. Araruama TaxID=890399 RepID=A0A1V1PH29_9BACT|nr:MAG: Chemotaxis protein cheW [Candidatus Magnetoglobus multicellularis str. Araruama]
MATEESIQSNQYLTFVLDEEDFALEIMKVKEVLDFINITRVPRMPAYLCGVINLRGNVVPVIDLRLKLGMKKIQRTVDTCIVIMEIHIDGELVQMGALTDAVKGVIELEAKDIVSAPKLGTRLNTDFIRGMGKQDEQFIIILDIDRVLSADDIAILQDVADQNQTSE